MTTFSICSAHRQRDPECRNCNVEVPILEGTDAFQSNFSRTITGQIPVVVADPVE